VNKNKEVKKYLERVPNEIHEDQLKFPKTPQEILTECFDKLGINYTESNSTITVKGREGHITEFLKVGNKIIVK
jgi:hypothetical protein